MEEIAIIDYGAGNLHSIQKAVEVCGGKPILTKEENEVEKAKGIILPGVGSFSCLNNIKHLRGVLLRSFNEKPILGICLGMQILFEKSEESPERGLSIFKGFSFRIRGNVKVPHMGWNTIEIKRKNILLKGIPNNTYFYFVHSYIAKAEEKIIFAETKYGEKFPSMVGEGMVFGTQFHPEKSGRFGLKLIKNFLKICLGQ